MSSKQNKCCPGKASKSCIMSMPGMTMISVGPAGFSLALVRQSATVVLLGLTICGRILTNVSCGQTGLNPLGHSLKRSLPHCYPLQGS